MLGSAPPARKPRGTGAGRRDGHWFSIDNAFLRGGVVNQGDSCSALLLYHLSSIAGRRSSVVHRREEAMLCYKTL